MTNLLGKAGLTLIERQHSHMKPRKTNRSHGIISAGNGHVGCLDDEDQNDDQ